LPNTSFAPARILALDFETACPKPGNACQIGLAWIEGASVVRREMRYIRPRDMEFTFTWCHGITAEHVWDQPEFPAVLEEFRDELEGALILAHNAGFDEGVMKACARTYGARLPAMHWFCTLRIARAVWPELKSKSLDNVARHLGIKFRHHDAAEDAAACAYVAIAAARVMGVYEVSDIPERLEAWRALRAVA
jgi:DNA polymerase-3 subunit epsilon